MLAQAQLVGQGYDYRAGHFAVPVALGPFGGKQAQAKASTRQRKALTRLKIIYGGALLAMPAGEREALLSMITPRMVERDRRFVSEYEAGASESSEGQNGGGDV